ncbi:hypothetical protein ACIP3B_33575 [Streptomyces anulatus]|uniref:hypothetical protein n=1 Tax=Streptomyces anulatus TaxID=1892 RepID=UPI0033DF8959
MTFPFTVGIPIQPLSRAAVVNARIRQLVDQSDIDAVDRAQQYAALLEEWAQATCPRPTPVRAA